jgi:transposase
MGRQVVSEFGTLDGVVEDPGGAQSFERGGWARFERGEERDRFKLDELVAADARLLGRKTHEGFAAAWPSQADEAGYAEKMNSRRRTSSRRPWPSRRGRTRPPSVATSARSQG